MSAPNGDKARFQRLRKAGVHRREKSRLALAAQRVAAPLPQSLEESGSEEDRGQGSGVRLNRGGPAGG